MNKKWIGLSIGLLLGIIIGILPFFADTFCGFDEKCGMLYFYWPITIIFSLFGKGLPGGDGGLVVFFIPPIFYPVFGSIIGYNIGKIFNSNSNKI